MFCGPETYGMGMCLSKNLGGGHFYLYFDVVVMYLFFDRVKLENKFSSEVNPVALLERWPLRYVGIRKPTVKKTNNHLLLAYLQHGILSVDKKNKKIKKT